MVRVWANADRSVIVLDDDGEHWVFNLEYGWRPQREAYPDVLARFWGLSLVGADEIPHRPVPGER